MPSNYTSNYQLNQWQHSDRVRMEDFNADNARVDAALAGKASTAALEALSAVVGGKASAAALEALSAAVGGKADAAALEALKTTVGNKADVSSLNALKNTVSGKADTSALNTLKTTVESKADTSALNTLTRQVTTLDGAALRAKCGSYTGTGASGANNAKSFTFSKLPVLMIIRVEGGCDTLVLVQGLTAASVDMSSTSTLMTAKVTWNSSAKQVKWYAESARGCMNESGKTYYYVAIY